MITLFQKIFPEGRNIFIQIHYEFVVGNASKITSHIFRIFDSDGNDYLDFKEYLMAIDIANRDTGWSYDLVKLQGDSIFPSDEEKLKWAFRLYDLGKYPLGIFCASETFLLSRQ